MKHLFIFVSLLLCNFFVQGQTLQQIEASRVHLPNGWSLTSVGKQLPLGDLPLNLAVSHNKKIFAVTNNGQSTQSIELFDVATEKRLDSIAIPKSWYGLAFGDNDKSLYASGGNDNCIIKYAIKDGKLIETDKYVLGKPWPIAISPAGIAVNEKGNKLFVVTKDNNSLYVFNIKTKKIEDSVRLAAEAYTCLLSGDKKTLYISLWGAKQVLFYNVAAHTISDSVPVGDHPNEMALSANGKFLFVANANDNSVSVIDTRKKEVVETLNAALFPNAPPGSTSNGVALSDDSKTLYIANADNNCLTVFDVTNPAKSIPKGFIPVGWYPTNVKVIRNKIYVTNGKGLSSMANPHGPSPVAKKEKVIYQSGDNEKAKPQEVQYIGGLFKGTLSIIEKPGPAQLSVYSQAVYRNTPYSKDIELQTQGEPGNPIPSKVGSPSPIKYVFYVIKENRTYDQVLGDVKAGNGDTSLALFGQEITPNQHKIVNDYVLMDNFYVDAEVSMDGHNWSMGAYANDFLEKTWPTSYGGRGGTYSGEGERTMGNNKGGFIWQHCKDNKVTYRTYGEFSNGKKANVEALKGHFANFRTFDLDFRDTARFFQWKKDFDSLLAINQVPQLTTLRFGNDHTQGMRPGKPTPYAQVADNDLAVGMFLDYLSKSSIWKESVVFILEDDAQNGADHVDAHRSPVYLAGPYVKRNYTDHTMYSTSGVLRTIELILGIPPMTQYDAAATPMWRSFTATPDFTVFNHLPSNVDLNDVNKKNDATAQLSNKFNWSKEDAVPDLIFNDILWKGLKGVKAPEPRRAAFVNVQAGKIADDDDEP